MFNLDQAVSEWRQQMIAGGIKTPGVLEELESHLRDDVEQQVRSGVGQQQAFDDAIQRIGEGQTLKKEFRKASVGVTKRHLFGYSGFMLNNKQYLRPLQVKLASSLLLLYWAFRLIIFLGHHPPTSYVRAALLAAIWGPLFLCIWLLSRGTNWARGLFLALFVGNCWLALDFSPHSAMQAISAFVQLLLQLIALVLLFLPTTNRWFLGRAGTA